MVKQHEVDATVDGRNPAPLSKAYA